MFNRSTLINRSIAISFLAVGLFAIAGCSSMPFGGGSADAGGNATAAPETGIGRQLGSMVGSEIGSGYNPLGSTIGAEVGSQTERGVNQAAVNGNRAK